MRLHAQSIYFENRRILLPQQAPWLADYIAELTEFPGTRYDDQVDSTTQFWDHFDSRGMPLIITSEILARARIPGPYARLRRAAPPWF